MVAVLHPDGQPTQSGPIGPLQRDDEALWTLPKGHRQPAVGVTNLL